MTMTQAPVTAEALTGEEILARAKALAPELRKRSAEIERARTLPLDVVELLRATGVFRMGFTEDWGGPAMNSMLQTEVIEALSWGDTSAGWCAHIGTDIGPHSNYLDPAVAREMFPRLDMITAGLLVPMGHADKVPGGFRLTGRWGFGSGINHCDWVISGAFVFEDGRPYASPDGSNPHESRQFLVPRDQVELIDNWHTTGLAGSGSCDYTITDVFVPEEHTLSFDNLKAPAGPLAHPDAFMRNGPGVPLGAARAALDYVRDIAEQRVEFPSGNPWRENERIQITLAECETEYYNCRAGVYRALEREWEVLSAGGQLTDLRKEELAMLPLTRTQAFRSARSIVNRLYDVLRTGSIYQSAPMDRWLRDTTTMCQHIYAQDRILQTGGAYLLGGAMSFRLALGLVR
jgi:alkylation response protein AidB-like acyl-CoA dehydrogenase